LFDRFAPSLSDGLLPISEFLIDHLKKVSPSKKYLKLPGLTDFGRYNDTDILHGEKYFLFCGNVSYMEIIEFILDAYKTLTNTSAFLYLVISGDHEKINELKIRISVSPSAERIKIFSHLTERELFTYYRNAIALLIPLRPTFQDVARFPHKTGEYLASGNPVISTNYGEIKYYFKDKQNMLLAETYDIDLFAEKMQFAIDNPELIKEIGINGKNIALQLFDYKGKAENLNQFFDEIIN
jgi:glycosyltransferase involved in cell wall biosynthesis